MNAIVTGVRWSGILTGTPDLTLSLINMQATLRGDTASYMQAVIPYTQLDDVLARPGGDIVIYKTLLPDGLPVELYRVNFNDLRTYQGARNQKLTISGRSTAAFPAPSTVALVGVESDSLQTSGARTLVVSPFNDVIPGDSIDYDSIVTLINLVDISANSSGTTTRLARA
jgi:hypothetical protein